MKQLLILILIFYYASCECLSYNGITIDDIIDDEGKFNYIDKNASEKNCRARNFSDIEKVNNYTKCCYMEQTLVGKDGEIIFKGCTGLTDEVYKNLKTYIDNTKNSIQKYLKELKINCNSSYLGLTILVLLLSLLY